MRNAKAIGAAAFLALAGGVGYPATLVNEGMRLTPYYDSVGVRTVCVGETKYVEERKYTKPECERLFKARYGWYSNQVYSMYTERGRSTVTPEAHAAFTDLAYNIGVEGFRRSSLLRHANSGNLVNACNNMLLYKFAGGLDCSLQSNARVCGGIWKRRQQMRELCLRKNL